MPMGVIALFFMGCTGGKQDTGAVDCALTYYVDGDGDGYGEAVSSECVAGDGLASVGGDCDDGDPAISPDATEVCDGVDNNCDGAIDEGVGITVYADGDGDGYGDDGESAIACEAGEGWSELGGDCDDSLEAVYPGAAEVCGDGVLNDCGGDAAAAFAQCGLSGDYPAGDADDQGLGAQLGDMAGWSVAGAGDVDGDGLDDALVGAPGASAASLLLGGSADLSERVFSGPEGAEAGTSVDGAGDVDGDGYADLIIGAPYEGSAGTEAGAAYLVLGASAGGGGALDGGITLLGDDQYHYAGVGVAGGGDLDGDGRDDVLIGAEGEDSGASNAGAVYALTGLPSGSSLLGDVAWKLYGDRINGAAGWSVDSAGDTDGDGIGDVLIGSPNDPQVDDFAGAAFLVRGPITGDISLADADAKLLGEGRIHYAGSAVAGAGDLDGDGLADLAIGAEGAGPTGTFTGAVYLVGGTVSGELDLAEAEAVLVGEDVVNNAGASVAGAGDTNLDGYGDLLVGAYNYGTGTFGGAAYLVLGGDLSGTISLAEADARFLGENPGDNLGTAVGWAGDVDGDGADDMIFGAAGYGDGAGAAFLFRGGGL